MTTYTASVPTLDHTGRLSPLVREALANGATAALDPADPHNKLVIAFSKASDAKAFKAKLTPAMLGLAESLKSMGEAAKDAAEAFRKLAEFAEQSDQPDDPA